MDNDIDRLALSIGDDTDQVLIWLTTNHPDGYKHDPGKWLEESIPKLERLLLNWLDLAALLDIDIPVVIRGGEASLPSSTGGEEG